MKMLSLNISRRRESRLERAKRIIMVGIRKDESVEDIKMKVSGERMDSANTCSSTGGVTDAIIGLGRASFCFKRETRHYKKLALPMADELRGIMWLGSPSLSRGFHATLETRSAMASTTIISSAKQDQDSIGIGTRRWSRCRNCLYMVKHSTGHLC